MKHIEPEPSLVFNLMIESLDWNVCEFDLNQVTDRVSQVFSAKFLPKNGGKFEYSLLLTNDEEITKLNHEFRHKDKATNVLSFPQIEMQSTCDFTNAEEEEGVVNLGDIAMSWDTFTREVLNGGLIAHHHYAHLLLHSLLHLVGYDHINDQDAEIMIHHEVELLAELKINNPYK